MEKELKEIYELGKKAQCGNEVALIKLIEIKRKFIKRVSYGDEDCYQFIVERVIKAIKNYNFQNF